MTKVNPLCCRCKTLKSKEDFYKDNKKISGIYSMCKVCCKEKAKMRYAENPKKSLDAHKRWVEKNPYRARISKIKSVYGINQEEYESIIKRCSICGTNSKKLEIDHSHQSGRVRGMLCRNCNKGLGALRDNPLLLQRGAEYLLGITDARIFENSYDEVKDGKI